MAKDTYDRPADLHWASARRADRPFPRSSVCSCRRLPIVWVWRPDVASPTSSIEFFALSRLFLELSAISTSFTLIWTLRPLSYATQAKKPSNVGVCKPLDADVKVLQQLP
jgi:hypothetical protein